MRNKDILKSFKREINLSTRVVRDRSKFHRQTVDEETWDEIDDFYRISVECHKVPSISASDDVDEGNWVEDEEDEYGRN